MSYLPPREYYATLPKHIAGAGAIFRDAGGGILLVSSHSDGKGPYARFRSKRSGPGRR
jgi:hypothetical protein